MSSKYKGTLEQKQTAPILWFADIGIGDIPLVGGKNASLGEMYTALTKSGIRVPNGFALTAYAYQTFLTEQQLHTDIKKIISKLDTRNITALTTAGKKIRERIMSASFSHEFKQEIISNFEKLKQESKLKNEFSVAVRSSATAEDLPDASFAGQQETFLNVRTKTQLLKAVQECFASLFTDRAISYREAHGYDHMAVSLSVTIQTMVRSDKGSSGVMFTLDTESGFDKVVLINAAYGLGEYVVKGRVTPDQYYVFKPTLAKGKPSVISKRIGSKSVKLVYGSSGGTKQERVVKKEQERPVLSDADIVQLANWGVLLESHYGRPQDIEWAKDGTTGELYIVQSRPETVRSQDNTAVFEQYVLKGEGELLLEGVAIGNKIGSGTIRKIDSPKDMEQFQTGDVLVTRITDPDWEPIMRIASAIITEEGSKTSHAAIVSREIGVPAIVGAKKARTVLAEKMVVTIDCTNGDVGSIYKGRLPFEVKKTEITSVPKTKTKVMLNIGDPEHAFELAKLPHDGVGLARLEFIFTTFIKVHPLALVHYKKIKDKSIKKKIDSLTFGYKDKTQFAVDRLAEGIAKIAAASYPHQCIVRLTDFKTNEYATMLGGAQFEPKEENPMLGWRGASRYYSESYKPAFKIECEALKKVRDDWGLTNVTAMVPFCRTPEEGQKVLDTMAEFGLKKGENGLEVYVMCEIPSNVILADDFAELFDGFSIGSNDLTQMILGVDRDSASVSHLTNPNHKAVRKMIKDVITVAHKHKKKIGICGQAPSDDSDFAEFLVQLGIDSISLNPDSIIPIRDQIAQTEKTFGKTGKRTNKRLLSLVAGIGFLGAALMSIGAGCGGYVPNVPDAHEQLTVSPAELRMRMEERLLEQQELALVGKMSELVVNDFADFTISYPVDWNIRQWRGGVTMRNGVSGAYVTITEQLVANPIAEVDTAPITINGISGRTYRANLQDGNIATIVELPYGDQIIEISGIGSEFDAIVQTLKFVNNTVITDTTQLEDRACVQVITYARQATDSSCTAFPTPCDVPDGWEICDASTI